MRLTGRYYTHVEPVQTYKEYREKIEEQVISSLQLNIRKIKVSSLKEKDKSEIFSEMLKILNEGKNTLPQEGEIKP